MHSMNPDSFNPAFETRLAYSMWLILVLITAPAPERLMQCTAALCML